MQKSVTRSPMSASSPSPEPSVTDTIFFINLLPFLSAQPRRDRHVIVVDRQAREQPPARPQEDAGKPRNGASTFGALAAPVRVDAVRSKDREGQKLVTDNAPLLVDLAAFARAGGLVAALDAKGPLAALHVKRLVPVPYAPTPLAVVGTAVLMVGVAVEVVERLDETAGGTALGGHGFFHLRISRGPSQNHH